MGGQLFDDAARALDEAGVAWSVLRAPGPADGAVVELDVLVDPADADRAEAAVAALGFARVPAWGRAPHRFWVAPEAGGDRWLKIDAVTDLAFGRHHELATGTATGSLRDRQVGDGQPRLAPPDHFAALALHALLDRPALRERDRTALLEAVAGAGDGGALGRLIDDAGGGDDSRWTALVAAVRDERWDDVAALRPALRAALQRGQRLAVTRRALVNRTLRHLAKPLTAASARGLSVVLLGPDGVGKSTLAEGLCASSFLPTRRVYAGTYPKWSRRRRLPGATLVTTVGRLWRTGLVAAWHQLRGRVVVFDRHPIEARVAGARPTSRRSGLRRRLLAASLPAPDVAVVLDAPAEVVHRRKPEHEVERLEADRRAYADLAQRLPAATVVDASAAVEDTRRRVTALVWRRYAERQRKSRDRPGATVAAATP